MPDLDSTNIILTGFMGTGKSTIGKLVAHYLNRKFIDTDQMIEQRHGMRIREIFTKFGEAAFRRMEHEVAAELGRRRKLVISTGGKLMLDPDNTAALTRKGKVFCLTASVDTILERITQNGPANRPLLAAHNPRTRLIELLQTRQPGYNRFPQIVTDNRLPEDIARQVVQLFRDRSPELLIK
jgi:shikimate kinase